MVIVDRESGAVIPGERLQGETYYTRAQCTRALMIKAVNDNRRGQMALAAQVIITLMRAD